MPKCRWCGSDINEGYRTCPNCHRIQNPILGRLQVFNAPSWLAVAVAGVALLFSYQQNLLVSAQVEEARKERERAETAVEEARAASDEARNALAAAVKSNATAKQANAEAKAAFKEAEQVRDQIIIETSKMRGLVLKTMRSRAYTGSSELSGACLAPGPQHFEDLAIRHTCYRAISNSFSILQNLEKEIDNNDFAEEDHTLVSEAICNYYDQFREIIKIFEFEAHYPKLDYCS